MRVDKGQLFDGLSVHQGVFSLTAAAGGDLYGIDTVNNSLLKIDPDAGSMLVIDEDPLSLSTALVHGLAYRPVPPPVPVPVGVPWPALAVPLLAAALIGHAVGNRNSRARRSRSP